MFLRMKLYRNYNIELASQVQGEVCALSVGLRREPQLCGIPVSCHEKFTHNSRNHCTSKCTDLYIDAAASVKLIYLVRFNVEV